MSTTKLKNIFEIIISLIFKIRETDYIAISKLISYQQELINNNAELIRFCIDLLKQIQKKEDYDKIELKNDMMKYFEKFKKSKEKNEKILREKEFHLSESILGNQEIKEMLNEVKFHMEDL